MTSFQTILHPTDFSESAEDAFRLACSIASDSKARIVVLHVASMETFWGGTFPGIPTDPRTIQHALLEQLHRIQPLAAARDSQADDVLQPGSQPPLPLSETTQDDGQRPAHRAGIQVEHVLREGDAAAEILRMAKELPSDLIVLGTHGRTGPRRMVMGSVAEAVLRHASCPVLTLKSTHTKVARSVATVSYERLTPPA
jgi:nucleotide-binding universal stress UspA family protein